MALTAYGLDPGADLYTELGSWRAGETVTLERPWSLSFDLDTLGA